MIDQFARLTEILQNLFEGYCIQFFFGRFAEPRLHRIKNAQWITCMVWFLIKMAGGNLFHDTDSVTLVASLLFGTMVLFAFSMCCYQGNIQLKLFLVIQFVSLRELGFLAAYSFLYFGKSLMDMLADGMGDSTVSVETFLIAVNLLGCLSLAIMSVIKYALLFAALKKIVKSCHDREKGRMGKEVIFYLLPAGQECWFRRLYVCF